LPTLSDARQALQPRATTLGDKVQGLRTDLQSMVQGRLQITADRVNSLLMDLDSALQNIQTSVTTYGGKVQQVQTKLKDLENNITTWITVGWLVGTILCLWVVVSQVIMIRYGWSLIRSKSTDLSVPSAPEAGGDLPSPATS
jgi:small-conductance mechanosensitive channel